MKHEAPRKRTLLRNLWSQACLSSEHECARMEQRPRETAVPSRRQVKIGVKPKDHRVGSWQPNCQMNPWMETLSIVVLARPELAAIFQKELAGEPAVATFSTSEA